MKVLLLGDAHGHWDEVDDRLQAARRACGAEAGIQVGDLGIDRRAIRAFARGRGRFALPLYVVDGNHDDHAYIARSLRKGEAPPAVSFDAKAGTVSVAWPDQRDTGVLERAKEGFTQMTLKR